MTPRYLFPSDYMADPAAHVFNDRLYIYPSHDREVGHAFDDDGGHFQMRDYHVISFDDVENGVATDHGVVLDQADVPWVQCQMWDSDVVEHDGRYYMVFSAKDKNGCFHLGVAVADNPAGPFRAEPEPIRSADSIDPCLFKDDDGKVYCYYGGLWGGQLQWHQSPSVLPLRLPDSATASSSFVDIGHAPDRKTELYIPADSAALPSYVALMSDDMKQFQEAPRPVVILDDHALPLIAGDPHRFFEASWMHKFNDKYYFSYSTGDSHLLCYAIGDNPYGPFTYKGVILDPVVGWTTHHCIVQFKGQWYLLYHDCVPSGGITHLRSLKVQRLYYDDDGLIQRVQN